MERKILHIDMNKFYATVEQMLNPELRNKAIAVCGSTEEHHGIVLTASAEAKKMGVKTGMANWEARQACPGLIMVPPQYDQYVKYSRLARAIYHRYSDEIEPFGMDECWVDISPLCKTFDTAEEIANEIRETIKSELGLTVSIGVSFNKIFAKLGSDMKKPDAVTMLPPDAWKERVWTLPVSELLYVGFHTTRKLNSRGIMTIGDLARCPVEVLQRMLGKNGVTLWRYANGFDRSRVMPLNYEPGVKSVSKGITCSCNLENDEEVWRVMLELSQDIGRQLRGYGLAATGVKVYIRESDIHCGLGKQSKISFPTQSPLEIAQAARILFLDNYRWNNPVRAVCVSTYDLVPRDQPVQLNLFVDEDRRRRRQKLEDCVYDIRRRFGKHSIISASLMGDLHMPDDGRHEVKMPGMMYS